MALAHTCRRVMFQLDYKINKQLYGLRDVLLEGYIEYLRSSFANITQHKIQLASKAVSCFILNTYQCNRNKRNKVGITLDETNYSRTTIVNGKDTKRKVSYTYMRSFLDFLQVNNYITLSVGGQPEYGFHCGKWQIVDFSKSYVTLLSKLRDMYDSYPYEGVDKLVNTIILRNEDRKSITFKMLAHIKEAKEYLDRFNEFSIKKLVTHKERRYDVQSYKVFNVNFKRGGKTFMKDSIQSLSKLDRQMIEIEGEDVCIFDFKGFEPSLAYSMSQEVMADPDPYNIEVDGYDKEILRKFCKLAMLIMLNSESKDVAHRALNMAIRDEFNVKELHEQGRIPVPHIEVKMFLEKLEQKHHLIADKFYVDFGLELQYAGSLINDYIVDHMMQTYGCLVVQVFDEFIAPRSFERELRDTMRAGYLHVCGFIDNCNIVKEK